MPSLLSGVCTAELPACASCLVYRLHVMKMFFTHVGVLPPQTSLACDWIRKPARKHAWRMPLLPAQQHRAQQRRSACLAAQVAAEAPAVPVPGSGAAGR